MGRERERARWTDVFDDEARARGFVMDGAQRAAAARLAVLGAELTGRRLPRAVRGVYLWGPVGRGKSWLMDTFAAALPRGYGRRLHLHDFFRRLNASIADHRGRDIDEAFAELVAGRRVLCLDEVEIEDIGDAMLFSRLLRVAERHRVTFAATSNRAPSGLLPSPLYHHLFEPAIARIEAVCDVVTVAGPEDYRERAGHAAGFAAGAVLYPGTAGQLRAEGLVPPGRGERAVVATRYRELPARAVRADLVWFAFADLCDAPVAAVDLLQVAERHTTWVVDAVPPVRTWSADVRQRFATLVDICCDREVRLFLAGFDPAADLGGPQAPPGTARTVSRLGLLRVPGVVPAVVP